MSSNTTPKFWFEVDGYRYGARYLTIAEQVQAQVEIERLTNGNYAAWTKSGDDMQAMIATMTQVTVYLNKVIVSWPAERAQINFLETDDVDFVMKVWEAYGEAAKTFRGRGRAPAAGEGTGAGAPAP